MESISRILKLTTAALLVLAIPACTTSSTQDFPVPTDFCGVDVDQRWLTPLIPAGTDFQWKRDMSRVKHRSCQLESYTGTPGPGSRDVLMYVSIFQDDFGFKPRESASEGSLKITDAQPVVGIPGEAVYGREGVLGRIECYINGELDPGIGIPLNDLILKFRIYESADRGTGEDRLEVIENFAKSYIAGLRDYLECDA